MDWDVEEGKSWVTNRLRKLVAGRSDIDAYAWDDEEGDIDTTVLQIWFGDDVERLRIPKRTLKYLAQSQALQGSVEMQLEQVLGAAR